LESNWFVSEIKESKRVVRETQICGDCGELLRGDFEASLDCLAYLYRIIWYYLNHINITLKYKISRTYFLHVMCIKHDIQKINYVPIYYLTQNKLSTNLKTYYLLNYH